MEKNQRDFYLNEQVKAIQKELGEGEEGRDIEEIEKKIKLAKMPKDAKKKAEAELKKLKLMSPMSAEATVVRNYIDVLTACRGPSGPRSSTTWRTPRGAERGPLRPREGQGPHPGISRGAAARRQGEGAHPVPGRPPGVGKTSLGQSIAKATGRKYVRMALGGMRDEAEIRGHRRTYIGALPGKVLQSLSRSARAIRCSCWTRSTSWAQDFRGDPSSALLEVLDPEQNHTFSDHYVEVDFDLSDVMFVATSNSMNIPPALLDRMEVIRLSGYTEDEKTNIALRTCCPSR
jgi:ATP-dependent Lon protease